MKKILNILILTFVVSVFSFAFENVNPKQFLQILKKEDKVILLDVRTPEEYANDGHIKGANLLPIQVLPRYVDMLKKYKDYTFLIYCRSGNRSSMASQFLEKAGFKKIYNLQGGIIQWKKEGLPVEYGKPSR